MRFRKMLIVFLTVMMIGACAKSGAVQVGDKAPAFSLKDMDGRIVNIGDIKGKVIILDFFASWCPPCREEIPDFIDLQRTYESQGFTVMGVSLVSPQETKEFAAKLGVNYPMLIDDGKVSGIYGPIRSIPTTFIIDKNFNIAKMYIGFRPKEVFESDIKELLK